MSNAESVKAFPIPFHERTPKVIIYLGSDRPRFSKSLETHPIRLIPCVARSTDISPREHVTDMIDRHVRQHPPNCQYQLTRIYAVCLAVSHKIKNIQDL